MSQQTLQTATGPSPTEVYGFDPDAYRDELGEVYNIDTNSIGKTSAGLDPDDGPFFRFQYMHALFYPTNNTRGGGWESEIAPIQFKVIIETTGRSATTLRDHLRDTVVGHLENAFNTGVYDNYLDGFNFVREASSTEHRQIAHDEVTQLGVPRFEVEAYNEDNELSGYASGKFNPFAVEQRTIGEAAPGDETWNMTAIEGGNRYELQPQGPRSRLKGQKKSVYVNGRLIGETMPSRGTVRWKNEYANPDRTERWSRTRLYREQADTAHQALRDGGNLYKIQEYDDEIYLVTSNRKPSTFDPIDPETITEEQTGREQIEEVVTADETHFHILEDRAIKRLFGKYSTPAERTIDTQYSPHL